MDASNTSQTKSTKYFHDTPSIKAPKKDMNLKPILKDGLVDDFDLFEKVLDYSFKRHLRCDPSNHPVLFSEAVVSI